MPRTLGWHLHSAALGWRMPGNAVLFHHGKTWHRFDGEVPGWADCGTWIPEGQAVERVGKGCAKDSPWDGMGQVTTGSLCGRCFAHERPLLLAVSDAMQDERNGTEAIK